jgi:hypothetical protein
VRPPGGCSRCGANPATCRLRRGSRRVPGGHRSTASGRETPHRHRLEPRRVDVRAAPAPSEAAVRSAGDRSRSVPLGDATVRNP